MATTIDYASDYDGEVSDYRVCPLFLAAWMSVPMRPEGVETGKEAIQCKGPSCAWWDADKERCAVLSIARNK